jgi:hypothetical protein
MHTVCQSVVRIVHHCTLHASAWHGRCMVWLGMSCACVDWYDTCLHCAAIVWCMQDLDHLGIMQGICPLHYAHSMPTFWHPPCIAYASAVPCIFDISRPTHLTPAPHSHTMALQLTPPHPTGHRHSERWPAVRGGRRAVSLTTQSRQAPRIMRELHSVTWRSDKEN